MAGGLNDADFCAEATQLMQDSASLRRRGQRSLRLRAWEQCNDSGVTVISTPWITGKVPSSLVGAAGEHYVMSQLLLRGCLAALTPRGAPEADILVGTADGSVLAEIQVKTRSGRGGKGWRMSEKNEQIVRDRLFYCFVDFGRDPEWPVYVMPSGLIAKYLTDVHAAYLATPGKHGQQRKDWPGRFISPHLPQPGWMDEYRARWDLITSG
jgi:hypothetical protein